MCLCFLQPFCCHPHYQGQLTFTLCWRDKDEGDTGGGGAQFSKRGEHMCEHIVHKYFGDVEMSRRVGGRNGQEAELYIFGLRDPLRDFKKRMTWTNCILGSSFLMLETEPPRIRRLVRSFAIVCVRQRW